MDYDEVWREIDAQRLKIVELLGHLAEDEWDRPSLCDGWTVRDVAAHLTLQQLGPRRIVSEVVRTPRLLVAGGMNGLIRELARVHATMPTADMIAAIRGMIGSRRYNFGLTPLEPLIDSLVHGQDIAIPLGRHLDMSPTGAKMAATRMWETGYPFHARKKLQGFRLTATDTDWSVGAGADVTGPISALLLLLTGRYVALAQLTGDGTRQLTQRR